MPTEITAHIMIDFSLTVKAATLIIISERDLAFHLLRKGYQFLCINL